MVGPSPCVNAEHTHSTGDLRLTMTHKRGFRSLRSLQPCLSSPLISKSSLVPEVLWPGVRGEGVAEVASEGGNWDAVHRTGESVGERLLRELQWEAEGRMPERGDLLFAEGSPDRDRKMEGGVQHAAAASVARLQAAGTGGL